MQSQSLPQETMKEEENTELTLKLQYGYGEETDSFIKPSPRWSSPFSCRTLCGASTTAYHKGQDMVSTPLGGKLEFEKYSGHLLAANCASVKREISGMDAVSCRTGRDESDDIIRGTPTKKLRLSKYQSSILEASFREHFTLCPKHKSALANKLNLQPRQVEVWFQNRRARTKLKRKEVECENLKRCCESLREENRRLEREVQALKIVMCAQSPNSLSLSTAHLSMCPSCEGLATENSAAATITSQFKTTPSCLSSEFPYSHSAVC